MFQFWFRTRRDQLQQDEKQRQRSPFALQAIREEVLYSYIELKATQRHAFYRLEFRLILSHSL